MISVLITSRVDGNVNHGLKKLMDSLAQHTVNPSNLEVLVKFDYDDEGRHEVRETISNASYPFAIITTEGPRGRGYIDIHHGYNQLIRMASPYTRAVGAMADDFTVNARWDSALLEALNRGGEYCIVHQRPHPRREWTGKIGELMPGEDPFWLKDDAFDAENLHIIDEAPFWSGALIDCCHQHAHQAGEPTLFPVSFTDAWTIALEYELFHSRGVRLTEFLPEIFINRTTCEVDQPDNERWDTDRKYNFDYIKSDQFRLIIEDQARNIACQLREKVSRV